MLYSQMNEKQLLAEKQRLDAEYAELLKKGLKLDMSRGKPDSAQLDLSTELLQVIKTEKDCFAENGFDCRNYGVLDGLPETKRLFAELLEVAPENIMIGGASSLNIMYDEISRAMLFGVAGGEKPWGAQGKIKFLCPVPGYDRHFGICELMGIEMINVAMTPDGPDMDTVERLTAEDESIKGIWCVPKYANPDGCVYSDETVRRFAALKPKAKDFRIFWDNAYAVHDLYDEIKIANILTLAKQYGNENLPLIFTSTSKISFAGAGVSAMAASEENLARSKKSMGIQTIGFDKLNQLRHVKYFKNADGIKAQMKKHAALMRPKFETVLNAFNGQLRPLGIAEWSEPRGGYFITLSLTAGSAKRVYQLAKEAGVTLTPAGAPFPYGIDPEDKVLRIAPSYPTVADLAVATDVLCLCVKLSAIESYIK